MAIIPSHVSWKQSWLPYALLLIVLVFITVTIMVFNPKACSVRQIFMALSDDHAATNSICLAVDSMPKRAEFHMTSIVVPKSVYCVAVLNR